MRSDDTFCSCGEKVEQIEEFGVVWYYCARCDYSWIEDDQEEQEKHEHIRKFPLKVG